MSALSGLARKMKEKELMELRSGSADLLKLRGTKAATTEILQALRKRPGTVSIVAEYRKKGAGMGSIEVQILPRTL